VVKAARREAARLLADITVPKDARVVQRLPGRSLARPFTNLVCNPIEAATARWTIPGSPTQLTRFLTAHVPASMFVESQAGPSITEPPISFVADALKKSTDDEVVFTFSPVPTKGTDLRVDAMVVPHGASCISSG
jgi:hypothetical protein